MERQPRVSASVGGGIGGMTSMHECAPMKSCPLAASAIRSWYPSVMKIGAVLVTLMVLRLTTVSWPQYCACVVPTGHGSDGPPPEENGVPARYMVEPSTRATLPAAGPAHCGGLVPAMGM